MHSAQSGYSLYSSFPPARTHTHHCPIWPSLFRLYSTINQLFAVVSVYSLSTVGINTRPHLIHASAIFADFITTTLSQILRETSRPHITLISTLAMPPGKTKSLGSSTSNTRVEELRSDHKRFKGKPAPTVHPRKLNESVRNRVSGSSSTSNSSLLGDPNHGYPKPKQTTTSKK